MIARVKLNYYHNIRYLSSIINVVVRIKLPLNLTSS